MHHRTISKFSILLALCCVLFAATVSAQSPIAAVMDDLVTRLLQNHSEAEWDTLTDASILALLSPEQRHVLATEYWSFSVNVPVRVSIMRDTAQKEPPFWLAESGFKKTSLTVRNENYRYEVWQKSFPAGRVGLGINGFDCHRPHYFVSVGALNKKDVLNITDPVPAPQEIFKMHKGAYVYHDWPDLPLIKVPKSLEGQTLLPTIRGRAREAHLIGAFRKTKHPSATAPDLITLTWSGDPKHTQTVQWRAAESVTRGVVRFRPAANADGAWTEVEAERVTLDDRNIVNDRRVSHFTAMLGGLDAGTDYVYTVGGAPGDPVSAENHFRTAPEGDAPFSFLWMSDTHNQESNAALLQKALEKQPDAAFLTISGDLITIGQYRDDWDRALANAADFLRQRPIMPSVGNHDAIDGLGSDLYRTLFRLPANGPSGLTPGETYSFSYSNALFVSLDVTEPIEAQTAWLEETLRNSTATWKIAVFHFPPYAPGEATPEILEKWCPLFDRYGVDLVLSGHVHYYLRTKPMRAGNPVAPPERGTVYLVSFAVPEKGNEFAVKARYVAKMSLDGTPLCQAFVINGNELRYTAYDPQGAVYDELSLKKTSN